MTIASEPTAAQSVLRWASATPQAVAVMEGTANYNYAQLAEHVAKFVAALRRHGVRQGALVVLESNSRYVHLTINLALEALGATVHSVWLSELVPDNKAVQHADFLVVENLAPEALPGRARLQLNQAFIDGVIGQSLPPAWQALLDTPGQPEMAVRLTRTSGTTGQPKFMQLKRRLVDNSLRHAPAFLNNRNGVFNYVAIHNFNFLGTYVFSCIALRFGHAICFSTTETALQDVNRFHYSYLNLLVGDAARVVEQASQLAAHCNPCSVGVIGGALSPAMQQALLRGAAVEVRNAYQANEALAVARFDRPGIGTVLEEMAVRIVDDSNQDMPPGTSGTIMLKSPRVIDGYMWDPALTQQHFIDGWFRTSDVGLQPMPGQLVVLGRSDDMLNVGGVKVAPQPIEENIRALPGVKDAVLLVFEDHLGASELHVVVERQDPAGDAALHERLPGLMTGYFGSFKVHYVGSLPRTDTGKVQRHLVRQQLLG